MEYVLFYDTNALLKLERVAFREPFIISQKTLEEIEGIKTNSHKDYEVKYKARVISRLLNENESIVNVIPFNSDIKKILEEHNLDETPDNVILASAEKCNKNNNVLVVTDDLNCKFISKSIFGLKTKSVDEINIVKSIEDYKGAKHLFFSDDEMSEFYKNLNVNNFNCLDGEYLIIHKSDGEIVDYRMWNGNEYKPVPKSRTVTVSGGEKVKPRNPEQVVAFDMLNDDQRTVKVITGRMGTGKDFIMISNAMQQIESGKYKKLVFVINPINVYNTAGIGYLPGDKLDKLKSFSMILAEHIGGEEALDYYSDECQIEIEYLGFIRGRDYKDSIIYCTEAENMTREHIQLLIGRVGEGSSIWLNGDFKQTDSPVFRVNNGLMNLVQKLAGHKKFGYVQLDKIERSETAMLVDLLD